MNTQANMLFIDRDGTLIIEPEDYQIDSFEKFKLIDQVIPSLLELKRKGFRFVMVSNQDGLGTHSFPKNDFEKIQNLLLDILSSQGIEFDDILICPHTEHDNCECRKPKLGLVLDYMKNRSFDINRSYVIGDRTSDIELANNMGIQGILLGSEQTPNWQDITKFILQQQRKASIKRKTNETDIIIAVDLNFPAPVDIKTGIGFFDHMLEQLAKHANISLQILAKGDLHIDCHHTVEDIALTLGQALNEALGNRIGIARYGFLLPMDETLAQVAIDLGGRPYCEFEATFASPSIENFSTEMVPHFFESLAQTLKASIHIQVKGKNTHHQVEACFKAFARALKQAISLENDQLPSTKGLL